MLTIVTVYRIEEMPYDMIWHSLKVVLYYDFVLRYVYKVNRYNVYKAEMGLCRVSSRLRQEK
mgnify:CR=1 FL=1